MQALYHAFGGSQKGLSLKGVVCGLALLAHSSVDEKAKCNDLLLFLATPHIVTVYLCMCLLHSGVSATIHNIKTMCKSSPNVPISDIGLLKVFCCL